MLNKELVTEKDYAYERLILTDRYIKQINADNFQTINPLGLEAKNKKDLETAVYYIDKGKFKLTKNAEYFIRSFIFTELTNATLKDILVMSNSKEEYDYQTNLVLDFAFSSAKNALASNLHNSLLTSYHKAINYVIVKAKEKGLIDNSNPYKNTSALIRKKLFFDDAMDISFDFSKVYLGINADDTILKGFYNYVNSRITSILEESKEGKTPEEKVIEAINNYYNSLSGKEKLRILKILSKNNDEVQLKIDNSPLELKNNKGILKLISPIHKNYTFYLTEAGLWSLVEVDGLEPVVKTLYTLTSKPISESIEIAKQVANKFQLGITPVWFAYKMYLRNK